MPSRRSSCRPMTDSDLLDLERAIYAQIGPRPREAAEQGRLLP